MALNWGLLQGGGFENALATGMAMGDDLRKRRDEKEYKNALLQFDPEKPETLNPIMAARPEVGLKLREDVQKRQAERKTAELTQRAMGGDKTALGELATVNFDRWKALDGQQREAAKREAEIFGNAALDILNRPPAERGQAVQAYAQQLGQQYPEIGQIVGLPPEQLEGVLRSAIAEAGMVKQLDEMLRPRYQAIPEGGTLVDTSNPQAVQSYMSGQGRTVVRTGKDAQGRPVVQYSDGTVDYAEGGGAGNSAGTFPLGN